MGAEIEQDAAALRGIILPGTARGPGTPAIEARFDVHDVSQLVFMEEFLDGEKIAIPAPIVEGNEELVPPVGEFDQLRDLAGCHAEGFVYNQVFARCERLASDFEVSAAGGRDNYQVDGRVGKEIFEGAEGFEAGIALRGLIAMAFHDCRQFEAVYRRDQGRMENSSRHSESDQTNAASMRGSQETEEQQVEIASEA